MHHSSDESSNASSNLRALGKHFMDKKEYKKAITYFTRSLSLVDDDVWCLTLRAECSMYIPDFSSALADVSKAVGLCPFYRRAVVLKLRVLSELNRHAEFAGLLETSCLSFERYGLNIFSATCSDRLRDDEQQQQQLEETDFRRLTRRVFYCVLSPHELLTMSDGIMDHNGFSFAKTLLLNGLSLLRNDREGYPLYSEERKRQIRAAIAKADEALQKLFGDKYDGANCRLAHASSSSALQASDSLFHYRCSSDENKKLPFFERQHIIGGIGRGCAINDDAFMSSAFNERNKTTPVGKKRCPEAEHARQLGNDAFARNNYFTAISHYSNAICVDGIDTIQTSMSYANRALAFAMAGDHINAIADAEKCLQIDPLHVKAFYRLLASYNSLDRYVDSYASYERIVLEGKRRAAVEGPHAQWLQHELRLLSPITARIAEKMQAVLLWADERVVPTDKDEENTAVDEFLSVLQRLHDLGGFVTVHLHAKNALDHNSTPSWPSSCATRLADLAKRSEESLNRMIDRTTTRSCAPWWNYFTPLVAPRPALSSTTNYSCKRGREGDLSKTKREEVEMSVSAAEAANNSGNIVFQKGSFAEAVTHYSAAILSSSSSHVSRCALYYSNRSTAYLALGLHKEALQDSTKALTLEPKTIYAIRRMQALGGLGRYPELAAQYERGCAQGLFSMMTERDVALFLYSKSIERGRAELLEQLARCRAVGEVSDVAVGVAHVDEDFLYGFLVDHAILAPRATMLLVDGLDDTFWIQRSFHTNQPQRFQQLVFIECPRIDDFIQNSSKSSINSSRIFVAPTLKKAFAHTIISRDLTYKNRTARLQEGNERQQHKDNREWEYEIAEAEAAKNRGNAEFEAKRYTKAVTEYGRAVELRPLHAVYYSNRSAALFALGDYGASEKDAQTALDLDDTKPKYYYRKMKPLLAKSQLEEIDEVYRDFRNKCGASATLEERKAVDEVMKEVVAKRKQTMPTNHENSTGLRPRFYATRGPQQTNVPLTLSEAAAIATQVLVEVSKAETAVRECDFGEAIEAANRALEYQPGHPIAHAHRAAAFAALGYYDEAICDANATLKVLPKDVRARLARGISYLETGEFKSAVKDFTFVLSIQARNQTEDPIVLEYRSDANLALGDSAVRAGQCEISEIYFERALEDNAALQHFQPKNCELIFSRASILRRLGRNEEASKVESLVTWGCGIEKAQSSSLK